MKYKIGIYDFETDARGRIHVYESRNKRKYYDMINNLKAFNKEVFEDICKNWYCNNVF